jgi:hypothetical protein
VLCNGDGDDDAGIYPSRVWECSNACLGMFERMRLSRLFHPPQLVPRGAQRAIARNRNGTPQIDDSYDRY